MHKLLVKEFLEREVPEVDCERLKGRLLARISAHEQKHAKEECYHLPRKGVVIIALLVVVNVYALIAEALSDKQIGGFSAQGGMARIADNIITIALLFSVGILADRNFLGACRAFRAVRAKSVFIRNFFARLPANSLSFLRSFLRS